MKTISFMLAGCLVAGSAFAQYGWKNYSHTQSAIGMLSSAKNTDQIRSVPPGYVNSMSYNTRTTSEYNFIIDRVNTDGDFSTASCFSRGYKIKDDLATCNVANNNDILTCRGTDALLTYYTTTGAGYVVAGSYEGGLFFSTLDLGGVPNPASFIRWGKQGDGFGKPILVESISSIGWFFICAPLGYGTFIAKVNNAGTVAFAKVYSGIALLNPRGMTQSPINQELAVVGMGIDQVVAADEGFLMRVDSAGNLINTTLYGDGITGDEWFNTIKYSLSGSGFGYIVGGHQYSQQLGNINNQPWALRLDLTGNVVWNQLIKPNTPGQCIELTDVLERANFPQNEYYFSGGCSTSSADNLAVWKMDQNGSNSSFPTTEFVYAIGSGNNLYRVPMCTQLEGSSSGLGVWTTDFTNGNYRFEKAYFNGENGCDKTGLNNLSPGLVQPYIVTTISSAPYVSACSPSPTNFQLNSFALQPTPTSCWTAGPVPGGSNQRIMQPTGITSQSANSGNTSVYPNPTNGKLTVSFTAENDMPAKIELRNTLGQVIKTLNISRKAAGNYTEEIDLENLQISSGIYFVDVTVGNSTSSNKVVYQGKQ